jgi:Na+/H+ antiporter NhaD/arsenite permease-like protein
MFVIGASDAGHAFSPEAGIDWNVLVLLLGMMLIVTRSDAPGRSNTWPPGPSNGPGAVP